MYNLPSPQCFLALPRGRSLLWTLTLVLGLTALLFSPVGSGTGLVKADGENLLTSDITASQSTLAAGEKLTFTVTLRNTGSADAVADVTVVLPPELVYVAGSVTGGGSLEDDHVVWTDVPVAAGASVLLTFQATPAVQVSTNTVVTTVAAIMSEHLHFTRFVQVTLVSSPPPPPGPNLAGSYKSASQSTLAPDEELTYTIHLQNSGTADATADVVDQLPEEVEYVTGSASDGGVYNSGAGTVSWSSVNVPAGGEKLLTFDVTVATVEIPTLVVNTVTITSDGDSFERQATVLLVPEPLGEDVIPPMVHSLAIDEQDVLTSPDVTLHISATDNVAVTQMYLNEWQLATTPIPHWEIAQTSGWVPYQADYPWTLGAESGVHFVDVWVVDAADNISFLGCNGLDYASLLLPGETVGKHGLVPYMVHYEAGEDVTATLATTSGDADLYVWFPNNFGPPDEYSIESGTATDQVIFTTPSAGTYLFLVHGYEASTYDLSITPGGGPRAWAMGGALAASNEVAADKTPQFEQEPVLTWSGMNPLAVAQAPDGPFMIYLPVVMHASTAFWPMN